MGPWLLVPEQCKPMCLLDNGWAAEEASPRARPPSKGSHCWHFFVPFEHGTLLVAKIQARVNKGTSLPPRSHGGWWGGSKLSVSSVSLLHLEVNQHTPGAKMPREAQVPRAKGGMLRLSEKPTLAGLWEAPYTPAACLRPSFLSLAL